MSIEPLKRALRADLLGSVIGVGAVDLARIDPDDIPRRLGSSKRDGDNPGAYWSLTLSSLSDRTGSWGSGPTTVNTHRTYTLRLEGWLGIVGTTDATSTWEALVEALADRLEVCSAAVAVQVDNTTLGLLQIRQLGALIDVVKLGNNSRFHHALLTAQVETFRRIG